MTPLLFMGQEWASRSPFLFFTDYGPELGITIAQHRRDEFRFFSTFADPQVRERIPNPQDLSTFERSRLNWTELENGESTRTLSLYRELIALCRSDPVLRQGSRSQMVDSSVRPVARYHTNEFAR
jgi:maltooligosyltrehalose trehalohydrolase